MMNLERFRELLSCHGSREQRWPTALRDDMLSFLGENEEARVLLRSEQQLDLLLDSYQLPEIDLSDEIMRAVPGDRLERLLGWLMPARPAQFWRPASAAALPLLLGVVIGMGGTTGDTTPGWEQQEQALLSPLASGVWDE